jgi:DNA-binding response OmpR family regulator
MSAARVLVVEDDPKTADIVALYLRHDGHKVEVEHTGDRALARLQHDAFDLLILDVMLPGVDGLEICRRARKSHRSAIILLTARAREEERIAGLDIGADDYVSKPFSPRELIARVNAVLRRVPPGERGVISRGLLNIDVARHEVTLAGSAIVLTASEFALLHALARRPGHVLSRGQLLGTLPHDTADTLDRTVDVHIRNLRRKIESDPTAPTFIQTVVGVGYRFVAPGTESQ